MLATINIPEKAKVILLEDSEDRVEWFRRKLPNIIWVKSVDELILLLATGEEFDYFFLDHDLGVLDADGNPTTQTGLDAARHIASQGYMGDNIVIHSWNPEGAKNMKRVLHGAVAIPFGNFDIKVTSDVDAKVPAMRV